MRRIGIMGLGLVAVLAFCALAAASVAQAGEYGQCKAMKKGFFTEGNCQAVAEKKGKPDHKGTFGWTPGPALACVLERKAHYNYTESACETVAEKKNKPDHRGHYEREPGPGYTSVSGTASLAIAVCSASRGAGEVTGLKAGVDKVTFTGCDTLGAKCTSEGQEEGTIETFPLESKLIDHGEKGPGGQEPASGDVWTEFAGSAASGHYTSLFYCTGKGYFRMKGWVSAVQTGDVDASSTTSTTTFSDGAGEQDLITETSEDGTEWSGGTQGGPNEFGSFGEFPTTEVTAESNTAVEQTEIKT